MQVFGQKSAIFIDFLVQTGTFGTSQTQKVKTQRGKNSNRTTLFFIQNYNLLIYNNLQDAQNTTRTTAKFAHIRKKQYLCTGFQNINHVAKLVKLFNICKLWKRKIKFVCFL